MPRRPAGTAAPATAAARGAASTSARPGRHGRNGAAPAGSPRWWARAGCSWRGSGWRSAGRTGLGAGGRSGSDAPAQAAHIADRIGTELAPHPVDQHVDGVAGDFLAPAVDAVFQLTARQDGAGALQ